MKYLLRVNCYGWVGYVAPGNIADAFVEDPKKARTYTDLIQAELCCNGVETVVVRSLEIENYISAKKK